MSQFCPLPGLLGNKRFGACSAVVKGLIYVFGGFDGVNYLSSVEVINPTTRAIATLSCEMNSKRYFACCANISDTKVCIFGGSDGSNRLNTCEIFDAQTCSFSVVTGATMIARRHGACAVTLRGKVFIIGGHDGTQSLASCEVFDPSANTFTVVAAAMASKRNFACAGVIHDRIYIVGGHDGVSRLSSCEAYDSSSGSFILLRASMTTRRSGACAVVANARMYILGGTDGSNVWSSCYVLDPYGTAKNAFTNLEASMTTRRSGACAVFVNGAIFVIGGLMQDATSQLNTCEIFNVHQLHETAGLSENLIRLSNDVEDILLEPMRAERRWTRDECAALKAHLAALVRKSRNKTQIIRAAMLQLVACESNYGRVSHQVAQALNDIGSVSWKRIPTLGLLYFLRGLAVSKSLCGTAHRSAVTFQYNIGLTLTKLNFLSRSVRYLANAAAVARQLGDFVTAGTCDNSVATVRGIAAKKIQRWFRDEDYGYAKSQTTRSQTSRMSNLSDVTSLCSTLAWSEQDSQEWEASSFRAMEAEDDDAAMPPATLLPAVQQRDDSSSSSSSSESSTTNDEDLPSITKAIKRQLRQKQRKT